MDYKKINFRPNLDDIILTTSSNTLNLRVANNRVSDSSIYFDILGALFDRECKIRERNMMRHNIFDLVGGPIPLGSASTDFFSMPIAIEGV